MMEKGQLYKGFRVLDTVPVEDCSSTAVYLRHESTGMEVLHLLNDDRENLFAFAFRTPSADSSGAAHVLEHSVLCGSEKYPIKDPFLRLSNQSVNTYLNAYTASDHTVFPASSYVRADYFNLFSVYADAVFFPLLRPEIFSQECCRLEFGEDGAAFLQGVVYNEMKGNYASFDRVASDEIDRAVLGGTSYAYDSGGDPLAIPSLTLRQLRAFHRRHYCARNCRIFLYGDIATEEQLDFLDGAVMQKLRSGGRAVPWPRSDVPAVPVPRVDAEGPADEDSGAQAEKGIISLVWRTKESLDTVDISRFSMELFFLDELLWGDDCAPVAKALLESGLGEDIAPQTGVDLSCRFPTICFALRGAARKDARKLRAAVRSVLEDLCGHGIPRGDIERTAMAFDFNNREIKRPDGSPYALVLLRRCLRGWLYGAKPWETLLFRAEFSRLRRRIEQDPSYLPGLIRRHMLQNELCSLVTVMPSARWGRRRARGEAAAVRALLAGQGRRRAVAAQERMRAFQNDASGDAKVSLVPGISVADLREPGGKVSLRKLSVEGVPFFVSREPTNGIVYFELACPADILPPADYPYLPFFALAVSQTGWKGLPWDKAAALVGSTTGGFGAYTCTMHVPDCCVPRKEQEPETGRDWLVFSFKVLEERVADAFHLLADCLTGTDFSDTARLSELAASYYNSIKTSVVPNAHIFALYRAVCLLNHNKTVDEIWNGVSSLFTAEKLCRTDAALLARRLRSLLKRIRQGGALMHVTATAQGAAAVRRCLPAFIRETGLHAPLPARVRADSQFHALTKLPFRGRGEGELFVIPGEIGFAACAMPGAPFATPESVADSVYAHYATHGLLWKEIRTAGGAYGVYLSPNSASGCIRFLTYRDPMPGASLAALEPLLRAAAEKPFDAAEVEKAVTGTYSDENCPLTPAAKGRREFLWWLCGMDGGMHRRRLRQLLSVSGADMQRAAVRFAEAAAMSGKKVVFCGKSLLSPEIQEMTGKTIVLPL